MIFEQKLYNLKTRYEFLDKTVKVTLKEDQDVIDYVVSYDEIDFSDPDYVHREGPIWINMCGMFFLFLFYVVGVAVFMDAIQKGMTPEKEMPVFLYLCSTFVVFIFAARKHFYLNEKYAIYRASKQNLIVLHDGQEEKITTEIKNRCKAYIRNLHGTLNLSGNIMEELNRFNQLRKMDIIDEAEYTEIFEKIKSRIREKNMAIDPDNDVDSEVEKFEWLRKTKMITEEEYHDAMAQLSATVEVGTTLH